MFGDGIKCASTPSNSMSDDWKNEDDIKADLRSLTAELRRLREELRGMVTPPKPDPSRAFLHRQSWPSRPPEVAAEQPPRKRAKPKKKG
jgi:hypothetical protein